MIGLGSDKDSFIDYVFVFDISASQATQIFNASGLCSNRLELVSISCILLLTPHKKILFTSLNCNDYVELNCMFHVSNLMAISNLPPTPSPKRLLYESLLA